VFDTRRNRIVMFGGTIGATTLVDTWSLQPQNPATLTAYGTGCAGSTGVPGFETVPQHLPWLGDSFDVRIVNAPPSTTQGAVLIGISDQKWGAFTLPYDLTPIGFTGCTIYASVELSVTVAIAGGTGTFTGVACNCPAVLGKAFYMQGLVLDAAATRPIKASLTPALRGVVGAR
jgi:hypothetical protein